MVKAEREDGKFLSFYGVGVDVARFSFTRQARCNSLNPDIINKNKKMKNYYEKVANRIFQKFSEVCKLGKCKHPKCECGHCQKNYHNSKTGRCLKIKPDLTTCRCKQFKQNIWTIYNHINTERMAEVLLIQFARHGLKKKKENQNIVFATLIKIAGLNK